MGKDISGKEIGTGYSQRSNGLYAFRYTNRFGEREILYDRSIVQLRKKAKRQIAMDSTNQNNKSSSKTLNDVFYEAMDIYRKGELAENTVILYKDYYDRYVKDSIGRQKINSIQPMDIKQMLNDLGEKYSQSVCGTVRACLLSAYDVAVIENIIPYNFVKSLKVISKREKRKVEALTPEQEEIFINYARKSFYYNIYVLILNTGMRIGEAVGLTKNNIDLENRTIHVTNALYYKNYKGTYSNGTKYKFTAPKYNSVRDIPINDTAMEIILDQLDILRILKRNKLQTHNKPFKDHKEFRNLLFLSRSGTPISFSMLNEDIHKLIKKINSENKDICMPDFGIHALRHTFASRCYDAGMDSKVLQKIMGHKKIDMTMNTYVSTVLRGEETQIINKYTPRTHDEIIMKKKKK